MLRVFSKLQILHRSDFFCFYKICMTKYVISGHQKKSMKFKSSQTKKEMNSLWWKHLMSCIKAVHLVVLIRVLNWRLDLNSNLFYLKIWSKRFYIFSYSQYQWNIYKKNIYMSYFFVFYLQYEVCCGQYPTVKFVNLWTDKKVEYLYGQIVKWW